MVVCAKGPLQFKGWVPQKFGARLVLPRPNRYFPVSPDKFCTDLPDARIASGGDVAEGAAADIPAWIYELRVVEDVEEFAPNLETSLPRSRV